MNDDGGVAPTRKGTNWVAQSLAAVGPEGGDGNDYSSTSVCGNATWSSSAEQVVGAHELKHEMGSHRLEKVK